MPVGVVHVSDGGVGDAPADGRCRFCQVDAQCQVTFPKLVCAREKDEANKCTHKSLFPMDRWRRRVRNDVTWTSGDVWSTVCGLLLGALAAGGGIGGGGALVPILVLIDGFTPASAVPLSKVWL